MWCIISKFITLFGSHSSSKLLAVITIQLGFGLAFSFMLVDPTILLNLCNALTVDWGPLQLVISLLQSSQALYAISKLFL